MSLALKNISISFGGIQALSDVSFNIPSKQITGLIGPNGAGKTTLFNVITRFYRQDSGEVFFLDNSINQLKTHQFARLGIARTFQNQQLFKSLTVYENLLVCYPVPEKKYYLVDFLGFKKQYMLVQDRIINTLQFLGLFEYKDARAGDLPLGTQKLIEMGRALVLNPKLLLLDEPAAGLNTLETKLLADKIININRERGITILLVEHDMSLVMEICKKIIVLDFGKKIADGSPQEITKNELVIKAYLGRDELA